jgi:DNA-binding CsgD family transcriptional regulator
MSNREVAARVILSPHTVGAHLRHMFRKLDISSRVELTRIVTLQNTESRDR